MDLSMIRNASRQLIYFALLLVPVSILTTGCQPGNRSICRSLVELAEQRSDDEGDSWQQALDETLSEEGTCVAYLDSIAERHGEKWKEVSLCYARATSWSDVETCDKVVATLDVSDICYHIVDLQEADAESDREADDNSNADSDAEADSEEADSDGALAPRSDRLNTCVEAERERYRESRDAYATYAECVKAAETLTAARECIVEHDGPEDPATDHSDDE
jgi:hypothetical protein